MNKQHHIPLQGRGGESDPHQTGRVDFLHLFGFRTEYLVFVYGAEP